MTQFFARAAFRIRERANSLFVMRLRSIWWRALGLKMGKRTVLPRIHVTWPHQVKLGSNCILEHNIYFKFDGVYQPGPSIVVEDGVFIGCGCEFNIRIGISIGSNCLIASGCCFVDHDHGYQSRDRPIGQQAGGKEARITIEDDVWIGTHAVVLKGVTMERGSILAAGSVLTRSVRPFEIWGGVPARKLRDRPSGATRSFD